MRLVRSATLTLAGALIVAAVFVSNAELERVLGQPAGSLLWGPTLFRILLVLHALVLVALIRIRPNRALNLRLFSADGRHVVWALAGMSLVGFVLRTWRLDTALWLDEILTMVDFAKPPLGEILTSFPNQNQHMLFSLLGHTSLVIFGEHAWALRIPSVLFGIASIWALYLLARKLVPVQEALLACALMTTSYHHIWFSQNARGYMGVLFFCLISTWLWLEAMSRNSWRLWLAYAVALFLGMWIHMTILFVIAAHGLIWLADSIRTRRVDIKPLAAWLLSQTLTLQALAFALPEFFRSALHEVSMPSEWTNPLWMLAESLRGLRIGFAGAAVVTGAALFVGAGWIGLLKRDYRAALAMILPAVLGGGAMVVLGHNLWPRFFFFCMGFGLLIVIHGAMVMPRLLRLNNRWGGQTGPAFAGFMILASLLTVPRCYALPKQDFIGAREYVERSRRAGDAVVVVGLARHAYTRYYAPRWISVASPEELAEVQRLHSRVSIVFTLPIELKGFHPELWAAVQRDFEPLAVFPGTLGGGEVFVYHARAKPEALQPVRGNYSAPPEKSEFTAKVHGGR